MAPDIDLGALAKEIILFAHSDSSLNPLKIKSLECSSCLKIFDNEKNLKIHIKIVHDNKEKKKTLGRFTCPKCDRCYHHNKLLARHLKLECGVERKYVCIYCDQRFKRKDHLNSHLKRTHYKSPPTC